MEIANGFVYHVRNSRSVPGKETIHVRVESDDGNDDRVFPFQIEPGAYSFGDKVTLEIKGNSATIQSS
jgi:hypothetical protein